jgi:hypothetical protein
MSPPQLGEQADGQSLPSWEPTQDVAASGSRLEAVSPFSRPPRRELPRLHIEPIGLAGLLLGGGAVLCAAFAWLSFWLTALVLPLAGIGTLVGFAGLYVAARKPRPRYAWATAGSILSMAVLVVALAFPSMLGPTYALSRQRGSWESAAPRAVPLAGQPADMIPADSEWPDASRFSVLLGRVRVEVVSAAIRQVEVGTPAKKKLTQEKYLVLRVRAHQVAGAANFTMGPSGDAAGGKERPGPTLTDSLGRSYNQASLNLAVEAAELAQKSEVFPVGIAEEVYLFDAPSPAGGALRLEIPAATWGNSRTLRFTIPWTMIGMEADQATSKKGT